LTYKNNVFTILLTPTTTNLNKNKMKKIIFNSTKRLKDLKKETVFTSFHLYKENNYKYSRLNFTINDTHLEIKLDEFETEKIFIFIEAITESSNNNILGRRIGEEIEKAIERKKDQLIHDKEELLKKIDSFNKI
jgi:hypothetical protein